MKKEAVSREARRLLTEDKGLVGYGAGVPLSLTLRERFSQ